MAYNWKRRLLVSACFVGSMWAYFHYSKRKDCTKSVLNLPSFSVESVLDESHKYPTSTHFIYNIQKDLPHNFHDTKTLERIISGVERKCEKKSSYSVQEVIKILQETDNQIKKTGHTYQLNNFDCDDLSFIGLAVGERFNIPLWGVLAPRHMFIRYDPDSMHNPLDEKDPVNKGDFNWETTHDTIFKVHKDREYIKKMNISVNSIEKGVYLKNLTKQELFAIAYGNKGIFFCFEGLENAALNDYNLALKLKPNLSDIYYNRSVVFKNKKDYSRALADLDKFIELDENFFGAYMRKGEILDSLGNYDLAQKNYLKAEELLIKQGY